MAYQNVGTPTFYIDSFVLYNALKLGSSDFPIFDLNPSLQYNSILEEDLQVWGGITHNWVYKTSAPFYNIGYLALLGHSGFATEGHLWLAVNPLVGDAYYPLGSASNDAINYPAPHGNDPGEYDGFSLRTFDPLDDITNVESLTFYSYTASGVSRTIGCISMGSIYKMKNAPNLSLKMGREYGGTKEFTTYNGSSMSNTMWNKPPKWGDLGAWELGNSIPALSRSGRRTWDLTFSYIDDGDLWGSTQSIGIYAEQDGWDTFYPTPSGSSSDYDTDDIDTADGQMAGFNYNLLTDDNFFFQVWHKTLGGTLPFIFQPDSNNFNPDQFAICRFKDSSLKTTQTAFNVYDISLSIEEVW